jgi:hypothetical protein
MMTSHIPANLDTFLQSLNGIAFYAPSCFSLVLRLSRQSMLEEDWHHGTIPLLAILDSQCGCASEISSLSRERNIFKIGDALLFLYPTARSMVGTSPFSGRLTTDHGNKFFA